MAEVPRSSGQSCRSCRPLQLHFLRFFTPLSDPQSKLIPLTQEIKDLCVTWASPVRLLEGNPFFPPPPPPPPPHVLVLTSDASRSGWGATLPPHRVSGVWSKEESLDHINSLELKAVFLALKSLEVHVRGQSPSGSFGQHHSRVLCQLPRRDTLSFSVSSGVRALGVVPSEGHPSIGRPHPGGGQSSSRLLVEGEISPIRMDFESPDFSEDLSGPYSSTGDRPVCVHSQLSTSQVLFPLQGSSGLEGGRTLLPVVRPSVGRHKPSHLFRFFPRVLEKIVQEGADVALVAPFWPQRPWFLKLLSLLAGLPRFIPLQEDLVFQPMSHQPHPRLESLHLSLWPLSGRNESRQAFLLELQNSQQRLLESPHVLLTIPNWNASLSGVRTSLVTPLLPL